MKSSLLLLSLVCLAAYAECYGGRGYDPLGRLLRNIRQSRKSINHHNTCDDSTEYTPVYVTPQDGMKEADTIVELPGQPSIKFSQYSGYVTVDPTVGRALFYYFTEAEDSSSKPLVLWLSGGPGCSSIGNGAFIEQGPFRVNPDGKTLWYNEYAWNNVANVLYLESPAGVGFSYSNRTSDYVTGDKQTAADSLSFLVNWLERFPAYKTRDFFVSGESYAGHYVPQLAALILENNKIANQTVINLKGIAIGNPLIDVSDNQWGTYDYYWAHDLISDEIHQAVVENCNFSSMDPVSEACNKYTRRADGERGDIDDYNIYAPLCNDSAPPSSASGFDPCSNKYVYTYLNTPAVQKALHANVIGIPGPWGTCSSHVDYNEDDIQATILPTIQGLMASDISVWIYSGDTDSVCPVTGTKYSLEKIGAPVKTPWYPWYTRGEVGGYVVEYQNLTFVTVRGAGHLVPSYQPERALTMFASFLDGKLPPTEG